MTNIIDNSALGEVMAELKAIRKDIKRLNRKMDKLVESGNHDGLARLGSLNFDSMVKVAKPHK